MTPKYRLTQIIETIRAIQTATPGLKRARDDTAGPMA
jgi:hypothetical protein